MQNVHKIEREVTNEENNYGNSIDADYGRDTVCRMRGQ